jgi:hypothetical protein
MSLHIEEQVGYLIQSGTDYLNNVNITEAQIFLDAFNDYLPEIRIYGYSYDWQKWKVNNTQLINDLYDYCKTNNLI